MPQKHMRFDLTQFFLKILNKMIEKFPFMNLRRYLLLFKKVLIARTFSSLLLLDLIVNIMCFKPIDIERKGLCMLCNKKLS